MSCGKRDVVFLYLACFTDSSSTGNAGHFTKYFPSWESFNKAAVYTTERIMGANLPNI